MALHFSALINVCSISSELFVRTVCYFQVLESGIFSNILLHCSALQHKHHSKTQADMFNNNFNIKHWIFQDKASFQLLFVLLFCIIWEEAYECRRFINVVLQFAGGLGSWGLLPSQQADYSSHHQGPPGAVAEFAQAGGQGLSRGGQSVQGFLRNWAIQGFNENISQLHH